VAAVTWTERDGMLFSPLLGSLGVVAGFTTRGQGSMAGSVYPLDEQARNRDALARRLGFSEVVRMKQVHRNRVVRMDAAREPWPQADAMWTDRSGVLLGVAAADCVPVLVADRVSGRIGAAHAGWQGTRDGVAAALVRALVEDGADPASLVASLGPSIGPCCYEIGEERARELAAQKEHLLERDGRIVFDLWSANEAQLRAGGLRVIELAGICTKSGGHDLWSYRARDADGRYGTQLGFIGRAAHRGSG
jgi:purine-nucleoside/S-methyl-5'-thioadenosine phosphorylase / adenosine deaminase